jgi:DNA helicase HerA-like ATPase
VVDLREPLERWRASRRSLEEAVLRRASSADGARFDWQAPVGSEGLLPGGYVVLEVGGERWLGLLLTAAIQAVEGPQLDLGAFVSALRIRVLAGTGDMLGRLDGHFAPGATAPFIDAVLRPATAGEVGSMLAGAHGAGLPVGRARFGPPDVPARLDPRGFTRHTFLCGQSGSGKTYGLGVVLEQLLLHTDLRLVVLDPNSDFVALGEPAGDDAPYAAAAAGVRVLRPAAQETPPALRLRVGDLSPEAQAAILRLDPLDDREEYEAFRRALERIGKAGTDVDLPEAAAGEDDAAARAFVLRVANLGVLEWEIWQRDAPGATLHEQLADDDWRALVVDLGTLTRRTEQLAVATAVLEHLWEHRLDRRPVLLVIDEAHNVCPAEPEPGLEALATEHCVRIAGEGRKFGLHLLLVSQRPTKVHPNVLSQCENLLLMRVNSAADRAHLADAFSHVPPSLIAAAGSFAQGETLSAGRIAPHPTLLRFGARLSREGGGDVPTDWIRTGAT